MTAFKSLTALMFLVAHITVTCMEQDSRNAETLIGVPHKQPEIYCYFMVSVDQSAVASLNAFRKNKSIRLNVDLVSPKTNSIIAKHQFSADFLSTFFFEDYFEGKGETGTVTFIYKKNPCLNGVTPSEQLAEVKKIALTELALVNMDDLYAQRLKQIKY